MYLADLCSANSANFGLFIRICVLDWTEYLNAIGEMVSHLTHLPDSLVLMWMVEAYEAYFGNAWKRGPYVIL